jgi:acyl dehydratase
MSLQPGELQVGVALPPLELPPISRATLALFAGASGDHNPIHIDIDFARSAGLDDVIAHGMLSMAYLARMLTNWVPQEQIVSMQPRFTAPTPVGAMPICTGEVTAIETTASGRTALIELSMTLPDGTVTLSGNAEVAL